jgi:uncharacterized protein (TIGR02001 family)
MRASSIRRPVPLPRRWLGAAAAVLGLGAGPAGTAHAAEARASLGVVSDYVAHGLTRSLGDPAAQAAAGISWDAGWSIGAIASTANLNPGPGVSAEYTASIAWRRAVLPDLALDLQLSRYVYPGDLAFISYDYTELRAAISLRDEVELAVSVVPDASAYTSEGIARHRRLWRAELAGNYPLARRFLLSAGLGFTDLAELAGTGYWYGNLGLQWQGRRLTASVSVIDTDQTARRLFGGSMAGRRVVGAIVWKWR